MLCGMLCCWFSPSARRQHRNKPAPEQLPLQPRSTSPPATDLSNACKQPQPPLCNQLQSPLLSRMPAELRCLIFCYAIGQQHDDDVLHLNPANDGRVLKAVRCFNHGDDELAFRHKCWDDILAWMNGKPDIPDQKSGLLSLLLTCRLIYVEAVNLLYTQNTFDLRCVSAVEMLPRVIHPSRLSHIRSIQISTAFRCPVRPDHRRRLGETFNSRQHPPDDSARWPDACRVLQSLSLSRLRITLALWGVCSLCNNHSVNDESILSFLEPMKAIKVKDFNVTLNFDLSRELIARLGTIPFRISPKYCIFSAFAP